MMIALLTKEAASLRKKCMRPPMKSTICFLSFLVLVAALIGSGCSATYQVKKKSELLRREGKGPIRALTVDSILYTFETFSFTDSLLSGRGTLKQLDLTAPFEGSI